MNEALLADLPDLADERLDAAVLAANDEFFAAKENLLRHERAVFREHEYTDRGKWMDGWETRRSRTPSDDWCIVRLGLAGVVRAVVIDTSFFRGNFPESASLEGCFVRSDASTDALLDGDTEWFEVLSRSALRGDSANVFAIRCPLAVSHLRLRIYPDGGVARLRVHGDVVPEWRRFGGAGGVVDLAALETGARVLGCSDMFFGPKHNLILPGRARTMGEGWETKRRRGPGHDWVIVALAGKGEIARVEIDTNHFKGNYPDTCSIEACDASGNGAAGARALEELGFHAQWVELLARTKLSPHTRHTFVEELTMLGPVTHLRVNVFPDGGISRLRAHGAMTEGARRSAGLDLLNARTLHGRSRVLATCCGATSWADAVAQSTFTDEAALHDASERAFDSLREPDWLEAFAHHPPIGQSSAGRALAAQAAKWSGEEQGAVAKAAKDTLTALEEGNRAYEARHGFRFIVRATGKSADEMLAAMRTRTPRTREQELATAADEQRAITRLRIDKLLLV